MNQISTSAPEWRHCWQSILQRIHLATVADDLDGLLDRLCRPASPHTLAFINAHAMNMVISNPVFYEAILASDTLLRDGSGVAILYRLLGQHAGLNLNGTDLIPRLIDRHPGRRIALYGTQETYLQHALHAIRHQHPNCELSGETGFHPDSHYLEQARLMQPDLIVLGMGMPKQERVAQLLRSQLDHPCLIVCGGAIIDFMGGRVSRAPLWMRQLGIEWIYRFLHKPVRMFRRYVVGNPQFLWRSWHFVRSRNKTGR